MKYVRDQRGVSLIEVVVTMGIFAILAGGIYFSYANLLEVIGRTRVRTLATAVLNKEIEVIRNLQYDDVGLIGGSPAGEIAPERVVYFEGQTFLVNAYVRNIDDAFDGKQGQTPGDTAPADYRLVQLVVSCQSCTNRINPITFTTWVAPQNLESSTQNGSLFINVFDANGIPVSGATVQVVNNSVTPAISLTDSTNNSGTLQLVDIPTSTTAYAITISKSGYTSAQTYTPGGAGNTNPLQPHATIASQQITEISFSIDRVSTVNIATVDYYCQAIPSVDMDYSGTKLIGASPDVLKHESSFTSDTNGVATLSNVEWDTYSFANTDGTYDFAGAYPVTPLEIEPNKTYTLNLIMEPSTTSSLLVTAISSSGLPIAGTSINITKSGTDITKETGVHYFVETNWANGAYAAQDGNIEDTNPIGDLRLKQINGAYPTSTNSYIISNTIDLGTASTSLNSLAWLPLTQPTETGSNSLQFQIASNTDNSTWNYVGPDGTSNTYFTSSGSVGSAHNGNRYIRYKAYLNTGNEAYTPSLEEVTLGFSSDCVPEGQMYFGAIPTGTYTVTAAKSGYTTATSSVTVGSGAKEVIMTLQ